MRVERVNDGSGMRTIEQIQDFLDAFTHWAASQAEIQAVAMVGSYARGTATDTSDIDLVVLVNDPDKYLQESGWLEQFGEIEGLQFEDYGLVRSVRVWYRDGCEVEYGLTTMEWAKSPLDEGTLRVIQEGMKVLFDRNSALFSLRA